MDLMMFNDLMFFFIEFCEYFMYVGGLLLFELL